MLSVRRRHTILTSIVLLVLFTSTYLYHFAFTSFSLTSNGVPRRPILEQLHNVVDFPRPKPPIYKPTPSASAIPIVDNFPLAASAHSAAELPLIPSWNAPPNPHVEENTPLFIGFTRNWRLLQQVVVSYITSGWPAEDIYVVENTGVMDSNALGLLSLQNPFFLNHTRLEMFGVNILVTPTLLTFAQLQNFYLWTATTKSWPHFFWSHMDLVSVSLESAVRFPPETITPDTPFSSEPEPWESRSLYLNCVASLRNVTSPHSLTGKVARWAMVFFSYDRLALVNVPAFKSIGAWDTMIPFYLTDCDMHARLTMAGYEIVDRAVGLVYDVASSLDDLIVLYRQKRGPSGKVGEPSWVDPNAEQKLNEVDAGGEPEKEHGKTEKRDTSRREGKEDDVESKARSLATLFTSHASSSSTANASTTNTSTTNSSSPNQNSKPDPSLWTEDSPISETYIHLTQILDHMQNSKNSASAGRNTWQARQSGGQGEPFYRDSAGFEKGIQMTIEHGRAMFREKWGHRDCDIYEVGYRADDAWRVEKDWKD